MIATPSRTCSAVLLDYWCADRSISWYFERRQFGPALISLVCFHGTYKFMPLELAPTSPAIAVTRQFNVQATMHVPFRASRMSKTAGHANPDCVRFATWQTTVLWVTPFADMQSNLK